MFGLAVSDDVDALASCESPDVALVVDAATAQILACNAAALALYGATAAQLLGRRLDDLLEPGSARRRRTGEPERHRRSDDSAVDVIRIERPLRYEGRPASHVTLIDVSAAVAAQAKLQEQVDFLQGVIRALPVAVFVKDLQNEARYVLCTQSGAELANVAHNKILGATDAELFAPEIAASFRRSDEKVTESGQPALSESTICLADGRLLITETRKLLIPDESGCPRYVLGVSEDVTHRRAMEVQLARGALHDPLTGLANRTLFHERLRQVLARREQVGGYVILHAIDLDHFKGINDTLGHAAGDRLLQEVASRITAACDPSSTTVARLGGDEFAVIQGPVECLAEAGALADRVHGVLSQPIAIENRQLVIGSSSGLSVSPTDGSDPESILRSADLALYGAKDQGRGSYRFFDADLAAEAQSRNSLEEDLREALALGQFELFYQPIVDIARNCVVSFEALLRWHHPTRGFVSPTEFVPLAESTGVIVQLGEWVLREACREASGWDPSIGVSVNLSSVQFKHPGLAHIVAHALAVSGLAPRRLDLEITESVLLNNNAANLAVLHQLRSLGIRISLDDFGTGYSSLGYLSAFPFNKIKIDRSFVRDIGAAGTSLAIVRSVIRLADDLGMSVTAEGVETAEQLALLRDEGCSQAQGYLFDRPRPAESLPAMLRRLGGARAAA